MGVFFVKFAVYCVVFYLMASVLLYFVAWFFLYKVHCVIEGWDYVGFVALGLTHWLDWLMDLIRNELAHTDVIESYSTVHWPTSNLKPMNLDMAHWIFEPFYHIDCSVGICTVIPTSDSRIVWSTYYYIILVIECDGIDTSVMAWKFIYAFSLCHIGYYDYFIATSCDEFWIVVWYF